jgi:hypothetical protein
MNRKKEVTDSNHSWSNWIAVFSFTLSLATLVYVGGYRNSGVDSGIQKLNNDVISLDERVKSFTKYTNESSNLLNELIHEVNLPENIKMRLIDINSKNREVIRYMVPSK